MKRYLICYKLQYLGQLYIVENDEFDPIMESRGGVYIGFKQLVSIL